MSISNIINLDCTKKENRIKLVKAVNKVINVEERQEKEKLEKICKSLMKKYNKHFECFYLCDNKIQISINTGDNSFSSFVCNSYYELLCKYILFVKASKEYDERVAKFKKKGNG